MNEINVIFILTNTIRLTWYFNRKSLLPLGKVYFLLKNVALRVNANVFVNVIFTMTL